MIVATLQMAFYLALALLYVGAVMLAAGRYLVGAVAASLGRHRGDWARERGLHKLSLSVFTHNTAAIALYDRFGFVEEGLRVKHFRRANGELWDALEMGLLL